MTRPADTTPDAWRRQLEIFGAMTGPERVEMAWRMSEAARELTRAGIRHRHPDWTDEQVYHAFLEALRAQELTSG